MDGWSERRYTSYRHSCKQCLIGKNGGVRLSVRSLDVSYNIGETRRLCCSATIDRNIWIIFHDSIQTPVCHYDGFTDRKHQKKAPRQMMFADIVVQCAREKYVLELELEQWREALEKRGMKVSRARTQCLNGTPLGNVHMQSAQLPHVTKFKYLGSTLQSDGDMSTEINKRTHFWGGSKLWTFSETMDIGGQSAVNRDFTVCIIRCVYRAELILGR